MYYQAANVYMTVSPPEMDLALEAAIQGLDWRLAISLQIEMGCTPAVLQEKAYALVTLLKEAHRHSEAATILIQYCNDVDEAIVVGHTYFSTHLNTHKNLSLYHTHISVYVSVSVSVCVSLSVSLCLSLSLLVCVFYFLITFATSKCSHSFCCHSLYCKLESLIVVDLNQFPFLYFALILFYPSLIRWPMSGQKGYEFATRIRERI